MTAGNTIVTIFIVPYCTLITSQKPSKTTEFMTTVEYPKSRDNDFVTEATIEYSRVALPVTTRTSARQLQMASSSQHTYMLL